MDIAKQLLTENSRETWGKVATYIGEYPKRFAVFMQLFLGDDRLLVKRCGQPFSSIVEKYPHLLKPYYGDVIKNMDKHPIPSVKRNVMRTFQFVEIPEDYETQLLDFGFSFLNDAEEAVAIKAFSMTVLRRICERYPELANELVYRIEIIVEEKISVGLTSRGKHELKILKKLQEKIG